MKYCYYCGNNNSESSRYCVHCGKPLSPDTPSTTAIKKSRKKNKATSVLLSIIVASTLVISMGLGVYLLIMANKENDKYNYKPIKADDIVEYDVDLGNRIIYQNRGGLRLEQTGLWMMKAYCTAPLKMIQILHSCFLPGAR